MGEVVEVMQISNDVPVSHTMDFPSVYNSPSPILASSAQNKPRTPEVPLLISRSSANPLSIAWGLEDRGNSDTKLNGPHDDWLPITASRNGNACYAAFHGISSGIGIQAFMLPVAFMVVGWTWGVICLTLAFGWQFYTIWLLIQLHESVPEGRRYSRYVYLSKAAFGEKLGMVLAQFPIMYLAGSTCVMLIITAGGSMRLFIKTVCGSTCKSQPLTTIECYLLFICLAIALAQLLPNLNSVAWVSFIGAISAVCFCTLLWVIAVSKSRPTGVSYDPVRQKSDTASALSTLNALGIIVFAFRGHNLILEIQATLPSSEKYPSRVPMRRGMNFAYLLVASCLFPLAIGGFWAYGDKIPANGGMLNAIHTLHAHDTSRFVRGLVSLLVVIHSLSSYQIYAMPIFDSLEFAYTSKKKKPCSKPIRAALRVFFGCVTFFIAVAIPFIRNLTGVIGALALPVTFTYPCFMWIALRKPKPCTALMWCINVVLGSLGVVLSVLVLAGGIWNLVHEGVDVRFFKP